MGDRPWARKIKFMRAIEEKKMSVIKAMLKDGFDIDTYLIKSTTAVSICISKRFYEITKYLIKKGCSLSLKNESGETPLHLAVLSSDYELVALLVRNRADLTSIDNFGKTALHIACEMNLLRIVTFLVEHSKRSDINLKDTINGATALMQASYAGSPVMVKLLLSNGADVHLTDLKGNTALFYAITNQRLPVEVLKLLLDAGADIHQTNNRDESVLSYAFITSFNSSECAMDRKFRGICMILIEHGCDVNSRTFFQDSPLHFAVSIEDEVLVRKLLNYGSDINAANHIGLTPLAYACRQRSMRIINLFIDSGADLKHFNLLAQPIEVFMYIEPLKSVISDVLERAKKCQPLKKLCRIELRKNLLPNIEKSVTNMKLPKSVTKYLLLEDQ